MNQVTFDAVQKEFLISCPIGFGTIPRGNICTICDGFQTKILTTSNLQIIRTDTEGANIRVGISTTFNNINPIQIEGAPAGGSYSAYIVNGRIDDSTLYTQGTAIVETMNTVGTTYIGNGILNYGVRDKDGMIAYGKFPSNLMLFHISIEHYATSTGLKTITVRYFTGSVYVNLAVFSFYHHATNVIHNTTITKIVTGLKDIIFTNIDVIFSAGCTTNANCYSTITATAFPLR